LASSTRVTSRSPFREYQRALTKADLPLFNPGAKNLHKDTMLRPLLGLMCEILDPREEVLRLMPPELQHEVTSDDDTPSLRGEATAIKARYRTLSIRVTHLRNRFDVVAPSTTERPDDSFPATWNFLDLLYELANLPPFSKPLDKSGG